MPQEGQFRSVPRLPRSVFKQLVLVASVFCCGDAAATARMFAYYAPTTARSFGMGGTGSADFSDVGNTALNPSIISFAHGPSALGTIAPLSLSTIEVSSTSVMLALGGKSPARTSSGLRFGVGVGWRHDKFELPAPANRTLSDNVYQVSSGGAYNWAKSRIGFGASLKKLPVKLTNGDEENSFLVDGGLLIEVGPFQPGRVSLFGAAAYSAMNIADPVMDPLIGSLDAVEIRRLGMSLCLFDGRIDPIPGDTIKVEQRLTITANFDIDSAVHEESQSRQQLGLEAAWRRILFLRAGYVHDDILVDGARDASVGGGVRWARRGFEAAFDFARWPYYHDTYGNVFSIVMSYEL